MKKGKWFLIAGIAIGVGAAVAGAIYAVHRAMNRMHFFDLDVEADDEFMESIIPQPSQRQGKINQKTKCRVQHARQHMTA